MIEYGAMMRWPAPQPDVFPRRWLDRCTPASLDREDVAGWILYNIHRDAGGGTAGVDTIRARLRLLQIKAKALDALAH